MKRRLRLNRRVPLALMGVGAVALAAGVVLAQPTTPAGTPAEVATDAQPGRPISEEAPPVTVAPPVPVVAPPVQPEEVGPAPPPKDQVSEKPVETPTRRGRYEVAVLQALDKVTAETLRFEARVGTPVRWKGLVFTVRACERSAPDEAVADSIVHLTIDAQPRAQPGRPTPSAREVFRGWMFAASPSLNTLEHPIYDAWAISCRTSAPAVVAAAEPSPTPSAPKPAPVEPEASEPPPAKVLTLPPAPKAAVPVPVPVPGPAPAPAAPAAPVAPAPAQSAPPAPPEPADPIL